MYVCIHIYIYIYIHIYIYIYIYKQICCNRGVQDLDAAPAAPSSPSLPVLEPDEAVRHNMI